MLKKFFEAAMSLGSLGVVQVFQGAPIFCLLREIGVMRTLKFQFNTSQFFEDFGYC